MKIKLSFIALLLTLSVAAEAQGLEAVQPVIDCGQVVFMTPAKVDFEIRNTSSNPLFIKNIRTSCGCTEVNYPHTPISKGASVKVSVGYDAKQLGHFEKQVALYTDSNDKPLVLMVRGVVVSEIVDYSGEYPFAIGSLRLDKNAIEFDDVNRGDQPYQRIHILNASDKTIQPQVMHLPAYLKAQVSPSKLAPKHAGLITITLDSRQLRDFGLTQTSIYFGMYPGDKVSSDNEMEVSTVLLPSFENVTEQNMALQPALELSTTELDLGSFDGKKKKKGEITITNKGRTPLEIRNLQMFTVGLEVQLGNKIIQPGSTEKLKITAIARQLKKARSQPRVLMITNDPNHAKVVIKVKVSDDSGRD